MEHMQLQLQLPTEKEQQLEQLIQELHDPSSANFRQWLTPDQFRRDFSLAPDDIDTIAQVAPVPWFYDQCDFAEIN